MTARVHHRRECWCGLDHSIVPLDVAEASRRITAGEPLQPGRDPFGHDALTGREQPLDDRDAASGHRLVLEIEVPDFYVDGSTQAICDEYEMQVVDVVTEEWMREEVGLTFVSIPGEKSQNSEFEVHARVGRIVGARIVADDA